VTRVDAVVNGRELTLDLSRELERLAPFGLGNPGVTLLALGCELGELGVVGDGKHLKLAVVADGVRSGAIAFGLGTRLDSYRRPGRYDVAFKLAANHWNGTVAPQLVVKEIFETPERYEALRAWLVEQWRAQARAPLAEAVFAELGVLEQPCRWRSLAESPAFLAALAESGEEALPEAA
jgi:hypothetical protein